MTDRTLREKIEGLPRFDGNGINNLGALISRYAVLATLDAHTAAQPAPVDVSEGGVCCHQGVVALADESQQPAPAHIAAAACTCGHCGGLVCCQNCATPPLPAPDAVADAWQPIETAPKDGTWVLGFRPRIAVQDQIQCYCWNAFGCTDDLWVNATDTNDFDEQPTHWQPLPAPPAKGHQP